MYKIYFTRKYFMHACTWFLLWRALFFISAHAKLWSLPSFHHSGSEWNVILEAVMMKPSYSTQLRLLSSSCGFPRLSRLFWFFEYTWWICFDYDFLNLFVILPYFTSFFFLWWWIFIGALKKNKVKQAKILKKKKHKIKDYITYGASTNNTYPNSYLRSCITNTSNAKYSIIW